MKQSVLLCSELKRLLSLVEEVSDGYFALQSKGNQKVTFWDLGSIAHAVGINSRHVKLYLLGFLPIDHSPRLGEWNHVSCKLTVSALSVEVQTESYCEILVAFSDRSTLWYSSISLVRDSKRVAGTGYPYGPWRLPKCYDLVLEKGRALNHNQVVD